MDSREVKNHLYLVVPAKAGTQGKRRSATALDSRFRGNDDDKNIDST